jgi:hypothetical protein
MGYQLKRRDDGQVKIRRREGLALARGIARTSNPRVENLKLTQAPQSHYGNQTYAKIVCQAGSPSRVSPSGIDRYLYWNGLTRKRPEVIHGRL